MAKRKEVYKCGICGNVVEVTHGSVGELACCGQPMELLAEKSEDMGSEKHVPVIERAGSKAKVRVGSAAHPMEESHFIEWVELTCDGVSCRQFLKPGQPPEAEFCCGAAKSLSAREFCTVHGLWKDK
jgi:superoxide reductase